MLLCDIGLKFWKVGSRKIFAISTADLKDLKRHIADSSSSDTDQAEPPKKKKPVEIDKNIKALRTQVDSLLQIQGTLRIPLSLRILLLETFSCFVCQQVIRPPVIFARCCKRIIGCESCIDTWYRSDAQQSDQNRSKICPQCRAERGYADTCRVHGLDDFLLGVSKITSGSETDWDLFLTYRFTCYCVATHFSCFVVCCCLPPTLLPTCLLSYTFVDSPHLLFMVGF